MKKLLLILLCLPIIGFGQSKVIFYDDEMKEISFTSPELIYNFLEIYDEQDGRKIGKLYYADRKKNDRSITFSKISERTGKIRGEGEVIIFNQSDFNLSFIDEWTKYDIDGKIIHKTFGDYEVLANGEINIFGTRTKTFEKEFNFEYYFDSDNVPQFPYTRTNLNDNTTTAIWRYDLTKSNESNQRALEIETEEFTIESGTGLNLKNSTATLFLENFKNTAKEHNEFNINTYFTHPSFALSKDVSATLRIGNYDHQFNIKYVVGKTIDKCFVSFTESIRGMNIKNNTISYDENQLKLYTDNNRITINLIMGKIYFAVNGTVVASSDYSGGFSKIYLSSYSKTPVYVTGLVAMVDGYSNAKLNNNKSKWSGNGSGFFISNTGYIVTNNHVIDNASKIEVEFKYLNEIKGFNAKVVQTDKINDLAILKIDDDRFSNVGVLPYNIRTRSVDVGTNVFALGYPKALTILGKEIKFTDGRISSKTGFQGDITTYQSTTPIQPGNSGGPLFDFNGNLIGINNAKVITEDVESVSYSIKSSYLLNLIDVLPESISIPSSTQLASKPLTEQIKILSDYVVLVKVK